MELDTITDEHFRAGMQLIASTVTVITATCDGERSGMTATAVTSLSADPASMLICVTAAIAHINSLWKPENLPLIC